LFLFSVNSPGRSVDSATAGAYTGGMDEIRSLPRVLGHRGYRARFPENTLLAFREALGSGADGIECDIQKTRDGRYVVIHDPRTGRVADADLDVARTDFEDLRSLDFGRGERIPTLDDLLRALPPGAWLDLELKDETIMQEDCDGLMGMLDSHFPRANLMVSSFNPRLLLPFRARGFRVGFLVGEETAERGIRAFARTLFRLRPQYVNLPIDMVKRIGPARSRWAARLLRLLGFSLLYWTTNEPAEIHFAARYADMLVTDEVAGTIDTLKQGFTGN
jgi:glycerophosphoryl diester phosphodiesterase